MSDPRAAKMAAHWQTGGTARAERCIRDVEAAGLTVINASDEETIIRVARALWDGESERLPMHSAYRVLAALAASR